jgi:hypothetical protein
MTSTKQLIEMKRVLNAVCAHRDLHARYFADREYLDLQPAIRAQYTDAEKSHISEAAWYRPDSDESYVVVKHYRLVNGRKGDFAYTPELYAWPHFDSIASGHNGPPDLNLNNLHAALLARLQQAEVSK